MSRTRLAAIIGSLALSVTVLVVLLASVAMANAPAKPLAPGDVVINEFVAKGSADEWVELHNTTAAPIDIGGWTITSTWDGLSHTVPGGTVIAANGYYTLAGSGGGDLSNSGDIIWLMTGTVVIDRVGYGRSGGAPLPPGGPPMPPQAFSAARTGGDTDDDAADWNLTITPTLGMTNVVPAVALGTSVVFNEFDNYPVSGNDVVEIYNPTTEPITITDWFLSDGDAVAMIITSKVVAPSGWVTLEENVDWTGLGTVDFSSTDVGYLFKPDGTRVDQLGWAGEGYEDNTYQRIPDGAGPNDGYDWESSGGPCTLQDRPSTLGYTNDIAADLRVSKAGPAMAGRGVSVDYTITYWNEGGDAATQVVVADELPDNVSYMADTSGLSCPACTLGATGPLTWSAGTLNMCGEYSFTLTAWISDGVAVGTSLTNSVDIATADSEITTTNNSDQWVTTVISLPKLAIVKTVVPETNVPPVGGVVRYTVVLENNGDADAMGVVMTDTLPPEVDFSEWIVNEGTATLPDPPGDTIVWGPWDVGTGDSYTLSFTATLKTGSAFYAAVVTNTVEFDSDNAGTGSAYAVFTADYAHIYLPLVMRGAEGTLIFY
jgi:uncharacterized repeat protein (TIGR01451 family)